MFRKRLDEANCGCEDNNNNKTVNNNNGSERKTLQPMIKVTRVY